MWQYIFDLIDRCINAFIGLADDTPKSPVKEDKEVLEGDEICYVTVGKSTYIIREDDIKILGELKNDKCYNY